LSTLAGRSAALAPCLPRRSNGGTLAPGKLGWYDYDNGNLTFVGAGNYLVETFGANSDKTIVTGTATLSGKVLVTSLTRLTARTSYAILSACCRDRYVRFGRVFDGQ